MPTSGELGLPVSGRLCAWGNAWLDGVAAPDDVLRVARDGHRSMRLESLPAQVYSDATHPATGQSSMVETQPPQNMTDVLGLWRRAGRLRMALPVPGDVRGVGGGGSFSTVALDAGEAVWSQSTNPQRRPPPCVALVPVVSPSAAQPARWAAFLLAPPQPGAEPPQVREAAHELTDAIRDCASALNAAQTAHSSPESAQRLARWRRSEPVLDLPGGHPPEAVRLLAQAERLHALLQIVAADPTGGAIDRHGIAARDEALAPLINAVRVARGAGYNASIR